MKIDFIQGVEIIKKAKISINNFISDREVKSLIVFSCDKNHLSNDDIKEMIPNSTPVFGAVFPQIIYKNKSYDTGMLIMGINELPQINIVKNISNDDAEFEGLLDDSIINEGYKTLFIFIDGFASRISDFIESLFNVYGLEVNFIGGGAGSLDMIQKPCIITNEGLLQDVAVIAALKASSGVGVKHGWQHLSGPYKVSSSIKNTVRMLNNKAAFDVYKEAVEKDSGKIIGKENFFDIAKAYPFGISKIGTENIVRDPIVLNDDKSLVCVGEVPQNSFVHILKGEPESLIAASRDAFTEARSNFSGTTGKENIIFIDCISRVLFLEDDFSKELEAVCNPAIPMVGALTLGEIANSGKDYLEFYNKTAVVSIIENL